MQPFSNNDGSQGVAARLAQIQRRIREAAQRAGRDPDSVTLIGVSKGVPPEVIQEAVQAGLRHLGENRVQEARDKRAALDGQLPGGCRWHLVGHLQRNKVNMALRLFDVFHSWDRMALIELMSRKAQEEGRILEGFLQVNIGREPNKHGVDPGEVFDVLERACALPGLKVRGLMCIPPEVEDPEDARPFFRRMRELSEEALRRGIPGFDGKELSMGMTNDFEVAIEEGATIVRVGRALFGPRPQEG